MALDPVKNLVKILVAQKYTAGAVSIQVETGKGATLPDPATDGAFNLVWWNSSDYPDPSDDPNVEIVRCTARSGDTLTVSRAQESTVASVKNTNGKKYFLILGMTKKMVDDIVASVTNHLADVSNPHSVTKTQVGLSNVDNTSDTNKPVSTAQASTLMAKSDFTIASKNLFNPATATQDKYVAQGSGTLSDNTTYTASDFIAVLPSTAYIQSGFAGQMAFYNTNKTYISGANAVYGFTTPSNAYYVRVSVTKATSSVYQLELGTVATSYVSYSFRTISPSVLPVFAVTDGSITSAKIADQAVTKTKIFNGAVSPEKTNFMTMGPNMFNVNDPDNLIDFFIQSASGTPSANTTYNGTHYIPVVAGQTYTMSYKHQIAWYDVNKVYISGSYSTDTNPTQTAPANACYVRCTVIKTSWAQFTFALGSSALAFEAFYYSFVGKNGEIIKVPIADNAVTTAKILDGNVTTAKIADQAVTPQKSDFLQPGLNLFNPLASDISTGYYVAYSTGNLSANAGYNATGYIPVVAGQSYTMNPKHQIAWYNSSKVYISGSNSTDTNKTQVAPAGAAYCRSSVAVGSWATFMFSHGTVDLPYEVFGYILKGKNNEPIKTPGADPIVKNAPEFSMPAKHYLLSGYENTLYFQSILSRWSPFEYAPRLDSGNFLNYSNLARLSSPTVETTATLRLYDLYDMSIKRTQSLQLLIGNAATDNGALRVIGIGDSYTYNGSWLKKVKALCPNLTFDGMRVPYGDATITAEGRGGWTLAGYFTTIHNGNVDSFTPFMQPPDPYKYYGNTAFWIAVRAGSTDYGIAGFSAKATAIGFDAVTGLKTSPATNDMMWNDANNRLEVWNGSAWVATAVTTGDFTFNFAKYRSTFSIGQPDIVPILLGLNDFRSQADTATIDTLFVTWKSRMETLVTSVHADSPNAKVVILLPTSYCANMENSGGNFTIMQNRMMWYARKLIITNFDAREAEKIYVVEAGAAFDPEYGFAYTADKPFYDYSGTETRKVQSNSPHPSTEGYYQLGVPLAGFIQKTR